MYSIQSAIYTAIYIGDGSVLYDITDYLENNQHILEIKDTQDSKLTLSLSLSFYNHITHTHTHTHSILFHSSDDNGKPYFSLLAH